MNAKLGGMWDKMVSVSLFGIILAYGGETEEHPRQDSQLPAKI
jgi:hypothetical protein